MRQFKLINGVGQTFDLMRKDAFFNAPSGLGFERSVSSLLSGQAWIITQNDPQQGAPAGEMVFAGYDQYTEFSQFISRKPITFCYAPNGVWYQAPCIITSFEKSEIVQESKRLVCPIAFLKQSAWANVENVVAEPIGGGKVYPYSYPYRYGSPYGGKYVVKNPVDIPAGLKITIFGPVVNPRWNVSNSNKAQSGRVVASIPEGNKLVMNSNDGFMELAEYTNAGEFVRDLYPESDFSTVRFVKAAYGLNLLSFSQDGGSKVKVDVEVTRYAESV